MALVRNHDYFTPRWQAGLERTAGAFMPATVSVYTVGEVTYVDNVPFVPKMVIYEGKARLQPVGAGAARQTVGDTEYVRQVRFQVPLNRKIIPEVTMVKVTQCVLNPLLVGFVYVVKTSLDSSNPFEQTFQAEVSTNGTV